MSNIESRRGGIRYSLPTGFYPLKRDFCPNYWNFRVILLLLQPKWEFGVWSLEFGVWSLEFGVWSLEFGVWSLEFGVWS